MKWDHHPSHYDYKHHFREDWNKDDYTFKGGWHHRKYYDEWWRKEGKASFEAYIERAEQNVDED
jgi:hypothetical protein